jgi:hypothetical protein
MWTGSSWDVRPVAGIGTRVWCWIVDQLVVGVVSLVVAMAFGVPVVLIAGQDSPAVGAVALIAFAVAYVGYFAVSYRVWGRSPGMMLGRLWVVSVRSGVRLTWGAAWIRALVLSVANVSGILAIIWLAVAGGSARRQGPHDSAARSVVLQSA